MQRLYFETRRLADTHLLFLVDPDDPEVERYREVVTALVLPSRRGFVGALNYAVDHLGVDAHAIWGAFGDDVAFRSAGWDERVVAALQTPGIAYGDDLIHGARHPSAVWVSSLIVRALDWLALPATSHQWADDGWKAIGESMNLLRFLPDVIVEHMHPAVGKAEWDDTYEGVFTAVRAERDHAGFEAWKRHWMAADLGKIGVALDARDTRRRE
jgi:hypothetical protein